MKKIILILFCFNSLTILASKIDSLLHIIKIEKNDSLLFKSYSSVINEYLNIDPEKAEDYSNIQLNLYQSEKEKATAYLNLGLSLDYQYKFSLAINSYRKSLNIFYKLNDSTGISKVLLKLSINK